MNTGINIPSMDDSQRVQTLLQQLRTIKNNEPEYLRLLHEVIEYMEYLQQPMNQQATLTNFQSIIIPEIVNIMNEKEPTMVDNIRHKIRRYSLEILLIVPFPDQRENIPCEEIIKLIIDVLLNDNEENAELAIKILLEILKFYKTNWDALENYYIQFIQYCTQLFQNLPSKLQEIKQVDDSGAPINRLNQSQDEQVLTPSTKSMKNISLVTHYLIMLNQIFDQKLKPYILQLLDVIFPALRQFPDKILPEVKNMSIYMEFLDILKNILSFFTFIFKKSYTEEILDNLDTIIGLQFKILKNTPQHGQWIRKDILHMIKYEIQETTAFERADRTQGYQGREHLYKKRNECLQNYLDDFLDVNTIFGKGKLTKELQYYGRSLIVTYISQFRDPMTEAQLKKCLHTIIKIILDPSISFVMRSTYIFLLFRKYEELYSKTQQNQNYINPHCELQLEILEALVMMMKELDSHIKIATDEMVSFKEQVISLRKSSKKWMNDIEQRDINFKELFLQDDYQFYEVGKQDPIEVDKVRIQYLFNSFFDTNSSLSQSQQHEINRDKLKYQAFISLTDQQLNEYLDAQKENTLKLVRNITTIIDTILLNIQETRRTKCLRLPEMKLMRKLLISGSRIIQSLYEMFTVDKEKVNDLIKKFAKIFQQMRVLQFRDLFSSVEDEFFGYVIEVKATKGDSGVYLFADYLMSFQQNQPNQMPNPINKHLDDQAAYMLEIFYGYINSKMRIFNKAMETEPILSMNEADQRFAKIATPDLQDALQKLTLAIGSKALSKRNDLRMKNLFFSVFVFCVKCTKSSRIIPYYYSVIRNLFKELNLTTINDNSNFVKEFIPLMQGLLETFLQAKDEAPFIKETNEICYSVPAKLKNLIEYLPIVSRPLIDSMKSNNIELIESGINTIQIWVSALGNYPEILDPVIDSIIPELNSLLYKILYLFPNYSFKLLGKFGAKSRMYNEDKEFKSKNYPEDGLKIDLEDKSSGKQISLGIDTAIDVVLLKIFDSFHKFNHAKLLEAYKLIKGAFICFIEPQFDMDYIIASIANAKVKNTDLLTQYNMNSAKYFDTKQTQIKVSALGKASESHAFEKILKCLLIACSLPKDNPETKVVHGKVKKFFKWVTQYFTLIYICKNGKLRENLVNEISPLVFMENICDFLYFNLVQGMPKSQNRSYHKGSITALKTMIRMIKDFYGEEDDQIYENLEFIQYLIQKICHLAYGHDMPKKVAANRALQIIIQELPRRTIKYHWQTLVDSVFHVLVTNNDSLVYQVEKECRSTLDLFIGKIGLYTKNILDTIDDSEKDFYSAVLDRVLVNIVQSRNSARHIGQFFIEEISKKTGHSVKSILLRVNCNVYVGQLLQQQQQQQQQQYQQQLQQYQQQQQLLQQQLQQAAAGGSQPQPQPQSNPISAPQQPKPITSAQIIGSQDVSWSAYLTLSQVENRAKQIYPLFKGGYTQVQHLVTYLDIIEFCLKHQVLDPIGKVHIYLAICEQLIKVLEDEIEKHEPRAKTGTGANAPEQEQPSSFANDPMVSNAAKAAVKYMKSEKQYICQNKTYDPFSHTVHPHQVLQTQHFEIEEAAKRDKFIKDTQEYNESTNASHMFFEIFEKKFDVVSQKAYEPMTNEDYQKFNHGLKLRINDFISRLFFPVIKASDISFEYVHHMYEIFPNHRLHTELICKCLNVLSEMASSQEDMYKFFKERQQQFFDQTPAGGAQNASTTGAATDGPQTESAPNNSHLQRKIDLYAVEIKSRMIAVYFKFFQREEQNIYKQAKKCLKRLLRKETNQQEALPNLILKECVRPSLNILSLRGSFPALYEQLAKLINVLHACFNDQLGRHLIKCYEQNKSKITDEFVFSFTPRPENIQQSSSTTGDQIQQNFQMPNGPIPPFQPDPEATPEIQQQQRQQKFNEDYERLLMQQNQKIEELEIANNIIRILYLLPTSRSEILRILMQIPDFEFQVLFELERKFEDAFQRLLDHYQINYQFNHEQNIRPISIRLGILKSDFRVGLAKYFNKSPLEAIGSFQNLKLMPVMLDIMGEPSSYSLRERVSRESEVLRTFLSQEIETSQFEVGLNLICIFLKYNKSYLSLNNNYQLVDKLQEKWNELGNFNPESLLQKSGGPNQFRNQSHLREIYMKIQKCLLCYCRNHKSKLSILFDLIKGYRYQSIVDMTATKLFFLYEVPYNFPLQKKRQLLDQTLKEIQAGQHTDEQKFMIFELAFMPSIIMHSIKGNDQHFKEIVDQKLMQDFVETFFGVKLIETENGSQKMQQLECLRQKLEISLCVSYEQFQIEIIKVINLMFRYFDFITIQRTCTQPEVQKISQFLYNCSKKANNPSLKEWAFYTLTSLFVMILDASQYEQRMNLPQTSADNQMLQMIAQCTEQVLMMIMQHSQNLNVKALVHKSFRNIMNIFSDPKIKDRISGSTSSNNQIDYVSLCLKKALIFEGRNTASIIYLSSFLLGHQEQFYYSHEQFFGRMNKIISRFGAQLQPNLTQKQLLVELSSVLITWISQRIMNIQRQGAITDQQAQSYQNIFTNILFYLIRTSVMVQFNQNEPVKDVLDLSNYCLNQIKNLVRVFPNVRIQFPFFNRLLQQDGGDKETIQVIKMAILNVSYILIKYQRHVQDFKSFFLEYIVSSNTKHQKGILYTCKILLHMISANTDPQMQANKNVRLKQFVQNDMQKCQEENIALIQHKIKDVEDKYQMERKPAILGFQDVAQIISNTIPHFTIRLIATIDKSFKDQGVTMQQKNVAYCDDEFKLLKDLATTIFRVVGYFRKYIIFDQMDVSPQKLRMRHNVLHQACTADTVYSQPIEYHGTQSSPDEIAELKVEEPNYDLFNKETLMLGLLHIVKRIKKMPQEQSIQILEIVQYIIQTLIKYNTNEYIIEWLRKVVDELIDDDDQDVSKLVMEQKASYVNKILSKIQDIQTPERKDTATTNQLIESIFEQSIRFLEKQHTFLNEHTVRLFEKIFLNLKGKSVPLKQRVFKIFEKLHGTQLFKKLQFFFHKRQLEDVDKLQFYQSQSQLLDFTLFNFRTDTPLTKSKYSSRLFPLYNLSIKFEKQVSLEENPLRVANSEYNRLSTHLQQFSECVNKYSQMKLKDIMNPISEIISINPSHSTDKNISDKLFVKLFYQYWSIQSREEQQILTESINQFLISTIPLISNQDFRKNVFPKTFLESLATLSPQIRIEPEVLQYLGKNLNLWHVSIPILENHINLYPTNERYIFSLNEMYSKLAEDDYIAGLRRVVTEAKETRSIVSYGQHQMWEELNQQFSQFIIYHAEEQGLYQQMDQDVGNLGKYQRQLQLSTYKHLKDNHKDLYRKLLTDRAAASGQPIDEALINTEVEKEDARLENSISDMALMSQQQNQNKPGNKLDTNRFKEMDLRIWDNLFIESLKVLNKWDQYRDIAHALQNQEMLIEYYWNVKDWRNLSQYEQILKKSESIKYQIYYIYFIIYQQHIAQFDEMFKQVIHLSFKEWDSYLPNYIDNVQFENLIMFQLVMETSEGGRNMIKEAQNMKNRGKLGDLKTAINIWRERIPNKCESIQMWKEVLENRNFIQHQISTILCPSQPNITPAMSQQDVMQQKLQLESQRQQFVNEFLDISWNYYKLVQMSRKQGLPTLAYNYWQIMRKQVAQSGDSEGVKFERFKVDYEDLKINLQFNTNSKSLELIVQNYVDTINRRYNQEQNFEPWQAAEMDRLIGEYYLKQGHLGESQKYLTRSIDLNKKESKTWLSYAKLNQIVFENKRSEVALQNCIKGYLSNIALDLPKSRLVIPQMMKFLKRRDMNSQQYSPVVNYIRVNLDQMPTWIWIFWLPQLLHAFCKYQNAVEYCLGAKALEKLSKQYPQSLYYPLKSKQTIEEMSANQNTYLRIFLKNIQSHSNQQVLHFSDKISNELTKTMKMSVEEEMYTLLNKILHISSFFKIDNFEQDFQNFLAQIKDRYLREENVANSVVLQQLRQILINDFLNEETKEKEITEIIRRLKNLKDFLHRKLSLAEQKTNLEQISPYLANFNEKGVELHGQYMVIDQEPQPQNTIYIQKFEPVIYRSGVTTKKIVIKGSNQRAYGFTISFVSNKEECLKHFQDERVLQIKMIMNQIFQKHKESIRRGLKFSVPIKCLLQRCKLTQDDNQFGQMIEIHDYLLQERGLDSDLAFNIQLRKVKEVFENYEEGQERTISSLSEEKKKQIIEETYSEMKNVYCQPYLLSSFFHRIFYTVDDLFIFKKQFTTYLGVNSFFSYIFTQAEYATLNQISFCKTSGRLMFNDNKLSEFLKFMKLHYNQIVSSKQQMGGSEIDMDFFDQFEKQEMQKQSSYLPFRLTNNIVDFIGKIGLHGLFAGSMTACSLALSKHHDKFLPLIYIMYLDEFNGQKEGMIHFINTCTDYLRFKITSLSQNKKVIQYGQQPQPRQPSNMNVSGQNEDGQQQQNNEVDGSVFADQTNMMNQQPAQQMPQEEVKDDWNDTIPIGQYEVPKAYLKFEIEKPNIFEEFNKKVFDLMDIAMDDKRLSQVTMTHWNAWF
eukprot:403374964